MITPQLLGRELLPYGSYHPYVVQVSHRCHARDAFVTGTRASSGLPHHSFVALYPCNGSADFTTSLLGYQELLRGVLHFGFDVPFNP